MLPECAVLLGVITVLLGCGIPLIIKGFGKANDERHKISERQTVVETKLDLLLTHNGFDMQKVNKAIKEHKEELEESQKRGTPSIGCINVKELYLM